MNREQIIKILDKNFSRNTNWDQDRNDIANELLNLLENPPTEETLLSGTVDGFKVDLVYDNGIGTDEFSSLNIRINDRVVLSQSDYDEVVESGVSEEKEDMVNAILEEELEQLFPHRECEIFGESHYQIDGAVADIIAELIKQNVK